MPMNLVPAGRFLAAAICLLSLGGNAALPNSSSVTVELDAAPISPIDADAWIVLRGNSNISVASVLAPDGSFTREFTAQAPGSVMVQNTLRNPIDLRTYDSFSFWARASTTRIGDFVYLIDAAGRKRWYSLLLWSQRGWQKPSYWLDAFVGQDTGFDPSSVTRLRFAQAGQVPGDRLWFGPVIFEHGVVNHGDAASSWYNDIGSGPITTVADGAAGTPTSVQATLQANNQGQADIAINLLLPRIVWDWSGKSFVRFYFKDVETIASHYFLLYDNNLNYRQWVFNNSAPGHWIRVTANLSDARYAESAPIDLSRIVYFEVGVFGGTPSANYTFQVDEISVY